MITIFSFWRQYLTRCIAMLLFLFSLSAIPALAGEQPIIVQSTTSTLNSGLYDYLLPFYQQATGKQVRVVAVGTGQALKNAERCDGDRQRPLQSRPRDAGLEWLFGAQA